MYIDEVLSLPWKGVIDYLNTELSLMHQHKRPRGESPLVKNSIQNSKSQHKLQWEQCF